MCTQPNTEKTAGECTQTTGIVIQSTGKWADVRIGSSVVQARIRGRLRLEYKHVTHPIAVGDKVSVRLDPDGTGLITALHPRQNWLSRRAAGRQNSKVQTLVANVSHIWIVQSVALPRPSPGLIDRILVTAEAQHIPASIVFNKMDLCSGPILDLIHTLRNRYTQLGYKVLLTSAVVQEGIEDFRDALARKTSVVTGSSGAGKSTLLNCVDPSLNLRTGEVSLKTRRGRHTTAYSSLLPLSSGGFVIDTPGIREFGVLDMEPWELSHHFAEFRQYIHKCHFPACTHDHEPGCMVKEAVTKTLITQERYHSYLNILESIDSNAGR